MGKVRRGGFLFITWKGDRDGRLVVVWDLDNRKPMKGVAPRRVLDLIAMLESEGAL